MSKSTMVLIRWPTTIFVMLSFVWLALSTIHSGANEIESDKGKAASSADSTSIVLDQKEINEAVETFLTEVDLNVPITYEKYSPLVSVHWGAQLIFSPSKARDRRLMYAYPISEISDLSLSEWDKFVDELKVVDELNDKTEPALSFAIVNKLNDEPKYTGTTVTLTSSVIEKMKGLFVGDKAAGGTSLIEGAFSYVVPYAVLKHDGIDIDIDTAQLFALDNKSIPYIAFDRKLPSSLLSSNDGLTPILSIITPD